jgi:hypothetical protein
VTLTARESALLIPTAFGGAAYQQFCQAAGLPPAPEGYGLLFCEEDDGRHVTVATPDLEFCEMLRTAPPEVRAELAIPPSICSWRRDGWPDDWPAQ